MAVVWRQSESNLGTRDDDDVVLARATIPFLHLCRPLGESRCTIVLSPFLCFTGSSASWHTSPERDYV